MLASSGAKGYGQNVKYAYDANGNMLSARSAVKKSEYAYNAENRMSYSAVTDEKERTVSQIHYEYDAFGRRVLSQDSASVASRTMYDGLGFDAVKTSPVHPSGRYTDYVVDGTQYQGGISIRESETDRYFHISDDDDAGRNRVQGGGLNYRFVSEFDGAERVYVSLGGTPVAVSQVSDGTASSRGAWYYGTDGQGSVRSETDWYGELKESYSYDVMGRCVCAGALPEFGYCGKRQGKLTGLYDYGFRDYAPGLGRFTTVDPVRDGVNWYGYCGGDAVNWVDLWGLTAGKDENWIDPNDPNGWQKWKAQQDLKQQQLYSRPEKSLHQDSEKLSSIPNMKKYGCNFMAMINVAQIESGINLAPIEIINLVAELQNMEDPADSRRKVLGGDMNVNNPDVVINRAFDLLGQPNTTATVNWGAEPDQAANYTRISGNTQNNNTHFTLGDSDGNIIYDGIEKGCPITDTKTLPIYLHRRQK